MKTGLNSKTNICNQFLLGHLEANILQDTVSDNFSWKNNICSVSL